MNPENDYDLKSINLLGYLALLLRWSWLIILAAIIACGAAFFVSSKMTPVYQAETTVLVNASSSSKTVDYSSLMLNSSLAQTYSQMMVKTPILEEVANRLGLKKIDPDSVNAEPTSNTQLILVTVEANDPAQAAAIANELIVVFKEQIISLQSERYANSLQSLQEQITNIQEQIELINYDMARAIDQSELDLLKSRLANYQMTYTSLLQTFEQVRLAQADTISSIVQIEPAIPPEEPIRPKTFLNVLIAGAVSVSLAAALIYLFAILDDTLKTPDEFSTKLDLSILGYILHHKTLPGIPVTEARPRSPVSEAFRTLRTNIQFAGAGNDEPLQTILITSTNENEGKSTVIVNLAVVLAQMGKKVCLIDADLRRPSVHLLMNVMNDTGLSQVFLQSNQESLLKNFVKPTRIENLSVLPSGTLPPNPSDLLGSHKMDLILQELKQHFEIILIDAPPALAVADAFVLLPKVQGTLLVMKPGSTQFRAARLMVGQFRRLHANILGIALNDVKMRESRYNHYYYGHPSREFAKLSEKSVEPEEAS